MNTPKVPDYFFGRERLCQTLHTRLRTECSFLNQHLFRRNLVPSPNCICGEIESNTHFLFHCSRYNEIRQEMLTSIQQRIPHIPVTTQLLLSGDDDRLPTSDNSLIFSEVQKYIRKTKRFVS